MKKSNERNRPMSKRLRLFLVFSTFFFFGTASMIESAAWARAGGGGPAGSRGSKGFSSPEPPSSPSSGSLGSSRPGRSPETGSATQASGGFPGRSPFMQGIAGGLAGGMIGSLLFGGSGHASPDGLAGGPVGFFEIILILLLLYLAYRFFRKRRSQKTDFSGYPQEEGSFRQAAFSGQPQTGVKDDSTAVLPVIPGQAQLGQGLDRIKGHDPAFREDRFKETVQDLFFRIQAGWTNRSLDGIEGILTREMAASFRREFESMERKGLINRLENIAIRKVELAEAWQEAGKDCISVLITANLLDYLVDASTREVVEGDKLTPVKFEELWTFCRDPGSPKWQLSGINQVER